MAAMYDEARRYVEGFTTLATWILSLPDDPANPVSASSFGAAGKKRDQDGPNGSQRRGSLDELVQHALKTNAAAGGTTLPLGVTLHENGTTVVADLLSHVGRLRDPLLLPPSIKPELLALSFPLLVHTYCELLSCGFERCARAFLDAYMRMYRPHHETEFADLDKCDSTAKIVALNADAGTHVVAAQEVKVHKSQMAACARRREDLRGGLEKLRFKEQRMEKDAATLASMTDEEREKRKRLSADIVDQERHVAKCDDLLVQLRPRLVEFSSRSEALSSKLFSLPFLRRAWGLKWQITLSASAYHPLLLRDGRMRRRR